MPSTVYRRLQELLGEPAVDADATGTPRAFPDGIERACGVLALAHAEGWRVRLEGRATWMPADAPADLVLSTGALVGVLPPDRERGLVRAAAGTALDDVRRAAADHGLWLPLDPPGRPERSIGSLVATATNGPLRPAGGVRELLAGVGLVAGDGRLVEAPAAGDGPRELPRLACGSFGAAGLVAWAEFRLQPVPRADRTFLARDGRDRLTEAGRVLAEAGVRAAAAELLSPAWAASADWTLAVRLVGNVEPVQADALRLPAASELDWEEIPTAHCGVFWAIVARAPLGEPVSLRLGVLPDGLDDTLDLIADQLGEGLVAAGAMSGGLRWAGEASAERLRAVRARAVARELPLTLERGAWDLRQALGHAGAYREGGAPPLARIREEFDSGGTIVVAGGS